MLSALSNMCSKDAPIDLHDDGLRLQHAGETKSGNYRYVSLVNHELVANALAERSYRRQIRRQNEKQFS